MSLHALPEPDQPDAISDEIAAMFDELDGHGGAPAYASEEQLEDYADAEAIRVAKLRPRGHFTPLQDVLDELEAEANSPQCPPSAT